MEKMAEVPKALQPRSHSAEESDGCSAMELGRNRVIRRNHVVTASELVDGAGLGDEPECSKGRKRAGALGRGTRMDLKKCHHHTPIPNYFFG